MMNWIRKAIYISYGKQFSLEVGIKDARMNSFCGTGGL